MKPLKGEASRDYGDVHTDIARVVQDAHRALGEVARRTADRTPSLPIYWLLDQYIGSMLTHERALEIVAVGASTRCKEQNSCAPKSF
jgi:hypothetical protein